MNCTKPTPFKPPSSEVRPPLATPAPILLDDEQGAAVYGIGLRSFLELQGQPWFPKPVMLGPRLKRHVMSELLDAVRHMPRQETRSEPAHLLRSRVERLKRVGSAGS